MVNRCEKETLKNGTLDIYIFLLNIKTKVYSKSVDFYLCLVICLITGQFLKSNRVEKIN